MFMSLTSNVGMLLIKSFVMRCNSLQQNVIKPFFDQQDIACLALASASWCLVTGGFSVGTERGGGIILEIVFWL